MRRAYVTCSAHPTAGAVALGLRYHRRMLNRADDLAKLTVLDEQGKAVELGTFWRDRTAVLVFTRHFG